MDTSMPFSSNKHQKFKNRTKQHSGFKAIFITLLLYYTNLGFKQKIIILKQLLYD